MALFRRKRRRGYALSYSVILFLNGTFLSGADGNAEKGSLDVQSFCDANRIKVKKLILLCDSPGAYYYGSNTYRNSRVCMSNDKANLQLYFTISDRYRGSDNVRVHLEAGIYDSYTTIIDSVRLCQLGVSGDNAYRCPRAGDYALKTYFYVPPIRDYDFHYTPDVKITFFDGDGGTILGCATTGTLAMHTRANRRANLGLLALGLCTMCLLLVFGSLLYVSYWRKKRIQQLLHEQKTSRYYMQTGADGHVVMETDDDEEQQPTTERSQHMSSNRQAAANEFAIANQQGKHYLNHHRFGAMASSNDEHNMETSLPTYNEPDVPIRPVI